MRNDTLEVIDKAQAFLHESGCDQKYIDSLEKLRAEYRSKRVFKGVDTPYNQNKTFSKTFDLLMPERFWLDHLTKSLRRKKSDGTVSAVKAEAVYVPLIKQLEELLNIKDIYSEIHKSRISTPGVYNRYEDGSNFAHNKLFNDHPNALQIHLYLDEVQLCNLGSRYDQNFVFVYFL